MNVRGRVPVFGPASSSGKGSCKLYDCASTAAGRGYKVRNRVSGVLQPAHKSNSHSDFERSIARHIAFAPLSKESARSIGRFRRRSIIGDIEFPRIGRLEYRCKDLACQHFAAFRETDARNRIWTLQLTAGASIMPQGPMKNHPGYRKSARGRNNCQ